MMQANGAIISAEKGADGTISTHHIIIGTKGSSRRCKPTDGALFGRWDHPIQGNE